MKLDRRLLGLLLYLCTSVLSGCGETEAPPKDPSLVPPPGQAADDLPGAKAKK